MEIGTVRLVDIEEEMKGAYLDYAMSVITARALPDVRDGLKPVQRRILYAMNEMGLRHDRPYKKSARVVGDVLGRYHPHGDQAVYDALVRMAQDFSMRYPLVDGQGNFGSVDGDPPAAMRYCVTGDTLVVTNQGLAPIGQLSNGSEDVHLKVLSAGGKVNEARKWFDSGVQPTLRVRTHRGFEVTGTHNHPLLTWQPGPDGRPTFAWKTMATIVPGDWLVLDRTPDTLWPTENVDLRGYHPVIPPSSRIENHTLPENLDETLAFLLGALTAEGSVGDQRIEFDNLPGEFADRFRQAWHTTFPTCRLHEFLKPPSGYGQQPHLQFQVVAKQVRHFIEQLGLERVKAEKRTIPVVILCSPKNVVAAFLRAYFEGDGAVEQSGRSLLLVSACSSSRKLLQQIQVLLLRFGIASWVRPDRPGTYKLSIRGQQNLLCFAQAIGFVTQRKQAALQSILSSLTGRSLTKSDYVPFLAPYVRRTARRHREWLSKHNFDRYPRLTGALPRLHEALDLADFTWIHSLTEIHYLFDQVTEVTEAEPQPVYSLRVESACHSFCANGFINHNTESRLTRIAEELLLDIDKETVDFTDNFDGTMKEPSVLPGKLPNLLLDGASGIAVGMATNIPPHNLNEICDAIIYLIDRWDDIDEISVDDLIKFVPGPDFPTGATILGTEGIREAYTRGKGRVVMRAKAHIEEMKGGRQRILVTELPYQVNKATLIERIAKLVRNKKIDTISDLRDESDRQGMSIVIELKRGAEPKKTLNQLLKYTQMQSTFGVNMLALVDGEPRVLPLKRSLQLYVNHRQEVIRRRSEFELARAKHRAHILEGLRIALKNLDEVINTIRRSPNADTARERLMKRFKLTEIQAQAILDMQLRRLAALEREKIELEYKELIKQIAALEDLLKNPRKILYVIKDDLKELQKTYGDVRRTKIMAEETEEFAEEDLIPDEQVLITLTQRGYVKRIPATTYRPQRKGGRGITGVVTREQDAVAQMLAARTLDNLLIFSNQGKVYTQKVHQLPDASRQAAGLPINNLISLDKDEYITQILPVRTFEEDACLVMATRGGKIKRTTLSEFESVRPSGIIALNLDEGDELIAVRLTSGADDIFIVTEKGQALRFKDEEVRLMGRNAAGVNAIKLAPGDRVTGMDVASRGNEMLIVTGKGYGKRTPLKHYPVKGRYTGGVVTLDARKMDTTGPIVSASIVTIEDEVSLISAEGMMLRTAIKSFSRQGRPARGTRVMDLKKGDTVVAVAQLRTKSLDRSEGTSPGGATADDVSDEKKVSAPGRSPGRSKEEKPASAPPKAKTAKKASTVKPAAPAAEKASPTPQKSSARQTSADKPAAKPATSGPQTTDDKPAAKKPTASVKSKKTLEPKKTGQTAQKPTSKRKG